MRRQRAGDGVKAATPASSGAGALPLTSWTFALQRPVSSVALHVGHDSGGEPGCPVTTKIARPVPLTCVRNLRCQPTVARCPPCLFLAVAGAALVNKACSGRAFAGRRT